MRYIVDPVEFVSVEERKHGPDPFQVNVWNADGRETCVLIGTQSECTFAANAIRVAMRTWPAAAEYPADPKRGRAVKFWPGQVPA